MSSEIILYDSFEDYVSRIAQTRPDALAFLCELDGKFTRISWRRFCDDVHARADELRETGKTCVAIMADGSYPCVVEIFAAPIAGLQVAMLDTAVPDKLLAQLLPYVDADMLWCSNKKRAEGLSQFLVGAGVKGAGKILFFTSGTTSRSKAVTLTDASLLSSAYGGSGTFPLETGDVLLSLLPLGHVFGFVCGILWPHLCGATVALGRGAHHVFDDWEYFHPTATSVVPILLEHMLRRNLINPELSAILVGAGDCPDERLAEVRERGIRLAFGYGLTETSSGVAISSGEDPHALEVCPGSTITLAEDGEILIETPGAMMQGYYKLPMDTAEVLENGVLHTGDLGSFDEDGRLHIQGRKKEMLVLPGGTKIYLPEYERAISEELGTTEMAVVMRRGMPVLVLEDIANDARSAVQDRLRSVMETWPRDQRLADVVELGRELPRTATGKIQRWIVEAELEQRWAALTGRGKKAAANKTEEEGAAQSAEAAESAADVADETIEAEAVAEATETEATGTEAVAEEAMAEAEESVENAETEAAAEEPEVVEAAEETTEEAAEAEVVEEAEDATETEE